MKILFIQKQMFPYFGIMSLSGYLRANQCETDVLIDAELHGNEMLDRIADIGPDLIGFSLMSMEHNWFVEKAQLIKSRFPSVPIVVGGIHAILYPEDLIALKFVDYVCCGEGEISALQVLHHVSLGTPIQSVQGIYFRDSGVVRRNELAGFVDLDGFTDDRDIYYARSSMLRNMPLKVFVSSRGCPYKCSFCVNAQLQKAFKGLGRYVRRKPVAHFINELESAMLQYGMKSVYIADDLFVQDSEWLKQFSEMYAGRIGIPYICTCRADMVDEDVVRYLSASGCHTVTFGVETGSEELRTTILKKNITDKQLFRVAELLTGAGIRAQTSNMFCLPGETVDDAVRTIDLNIRIGASFTMSAIFMPFPKTELAELCIKKGYLKEGYSFQDMPHSFITRSVLELKDRGVIERLQKVAGISIQYPRLRGAMIFLAKYVGIYNLHFLIYLVGTVLRFRAERKLGIADTLRYVWSYRKNV